MWRTLLWINRNAQSAAMASTAIVPPYISAIDTTNAITKAISAVRNQPEMTASTPVMRYTALSRPHARSASELPMATMNVT